MADSLRYLPPSGKVFGREEIKAITLSAEDGHWTSGRWAARFSKELATYLKVRWSFLTNSGSSANLLAVSALMSPTLSRRLHRGDKVVTVAAGFPTTIAPIFQNGLIPIFVDIDLATYGVNIESLRASMEHKPKAIILAHTLGNPFNLDEVLKLCHEFKIPLIEDNCDALGSLWNGKPTGSFGLMSTQSFYPAHHITTGEGGAVSTSSPKLKLIIESLRDWGRDCWCETGEDNTCGKRFDWQLGQLPHGYDHKYTYSHLGYNLKMTDMQASIGVVQMARLAHFTTKRRANFHLLDSLLHSSDAEKHFIMPKHLVKATPSWFGYPLTIREGAPFDRPMLIRYLEERGIGTRPIFAGNFTKQPALATEEYIISGSLDKTNMAMEAAFWVGVWPGLTSTEIIRIARTIIDFIKRVK